MKIASLLVLLIVLPALALAAPTTLRDCQGRPWRPLSLPTGTKAAVIIFITDDCPAANTYAPEINRLCERYAPKGVRFFLVEADADTRAQDAARHAKAYGFSCPVLLDPNQKMIARCDATVTTEAAVFTPDGSLRYRGRIDDRYYALGRARPAPTTHDLADALDALLAGRPVAHARTQAFGCSITRK